MAEAGTLAPDTNLLAYETSRRMLLGVAQETGHALVVLPEVFRETRRRIAAVTTENWIDRLDPDDRFTDAQKASIVEGAAAGAVAGFEEAVQRPDNAFEAISGSLEETWAAHRIARNLPRGIVRNLGAGNMEGDPLVLAEAVVFDVTLLSTNNLNTIWHGPANEWAARVFARRTQLVYTPDETLSHLSGDSCHLRYAWSLAYMSRPFAAITDDLEERSLYEDALERLRGAGFLTTAAESRWLYEEDDDFQSSLRAAAGRSGVHSTTRVERDIGASLLAGARDRGWSPG